MPGPIAKPVMRRLHIQYVKRSLIEMVAITTVTGLLFKHFVMDARKKVYDEFYRTYDVDAALEKMNAYGLMQSSPPK